MKIYVCTNNRPHSGQPSCAARGSEQLIDLLRQEITQRGLDLQVKTSVCMGHCEQGPNIKPAGLETRHRMTEAAIYQLLDDLM